MQAQRSHERAWGVVGGRNLPVAITVGGALAAVFLVTLFWHPAAFTTVVAVFTTVAYVESARVLRTAGRHVYTPVLVVATLALLVGVAVYGASAQGPGAALLVVLAVLWALADRERRDVDAIALTTFFGLWVGLLASFAIVLVGRADGPVAVLAVVGSTVLGDIGAYGFGVAFGRHKIAPHVSPNKSWEGLLGGVFVAGAVAALVLPRIGDRFTPATAAVIAVACVLAGFVGDLTESLLKRDLGVKDFGFVLPGHGGVLDRVDGILFALPVGTFLYDLLT